MDALTGVLFFRKKVLTCATHVLIIRFNNQQRRLGELKTMIKSIRHKGLKEAHETRRYGRIPSELRKRVMQIMDLLERADELEDMNFPNLRLHEYLGKRKGTYSVDVNDVWRITFKWIGGAVDVNLEQPH